jgi:hypothetical protein
MTSRRPPSRLHQSRCKYWGNVYREVDIRNDDNNNNHNSGDDNNIPAADDSNDDDDEDDNNTSALVPHSAAAALLPPDIPVPHYAAATLSPLATVADVGSIIHPYVGSLVLQCQLLPLSTSDNALPSSWSI